MSLPKIGDIKKWSFGEMTSNPDGKTSVTSTSGFMIVVVGCLSFLLGVIDKMFIDESMDIITQAIAFTMIQALITKLQLKNEQSNPRIPSHSNKKS